METKFVETKVSYCGFRKPGRKNEKKDVCPEDVSVKNDQEACLYQQKKKYRYWQRSDQHDLLTPDAVPDTGCPFGGSLWQLWVNYCLAHEEAHRKNAKHVYFGVCAPSNNERLLRHGDNLKSFRELIREPERFIFIDLDQLVSEIAGRTGGELTAWVDGLRARYTKI